MKKRTIFTFRVLLVVSIFYYYGMPSYSQNKRVAAPKKTNTRTKLKTSQRVRPKFPDKYSALDDNRAIKVITDEMITNTLEIARQYYLKGNISLNNNDSITATKHYERALEQMGKISNYTEIETNIEYSELYEDILKDYKVLVQRNYADADLSLVPKELLFAEEVKDSTNITEPLNDTNDNRSDFVKPPNADSSVDYVFAIPKIDELIIPFSENEAIDLQIDFLTKGKGAKWMKTWIERSSRWFPLMQEIAAREGMPKEILLLTFYESGLDPCIESKAGAVGLWQFLYTSGMDYSLNRRQSIWVDERKDPERSTRAAMRYLKDLYLYFNDWYLALVAYNWGWGNVRRALRQCNVEKPTYWDIRNQKNIKMPKEAKNYVPLFIAIMRITSEPEKYGIDVKSLNYLPEFKYDIVELEAATNLSAVAKAIGVGTLEIKELNPELQYDITPPDRRLYRLRVPVGSSKDFNTHFAKLTKEEKQPFLKHKVKKGETIIAISEKFDVAIDELLDINDIETQTINLETNIDLRIPIGGRSYSQSKLVPINEELITKTEIAEVDSSMYVVVQNESLYDIASKKGKSPSDLRNWNKLSIDQDTILEGNVLYLTDNNFSKNINSDITDLIKNKLTSDKQTDSYNTTASTKPKKATTTHKVKSGETLSGIAKKYGMSEKTLRGMNTNIRDDGIIRVGETLIVSGNATNDNIVKIASKNNIKEKNKYHTVKSGDNLSKIAKKYDTTVQKLQTLNKKIKPNVLSLGQKIRVK